MERKCLAAALIALAFLPVQAFATDQKEIELLSQSSITLIQAIEVAEADVGGKAISAEIEDDRSSPVFEIKVVRDNQVYEVKVDGKKAAVIDKRAERKD